MPWSLPPPDLLASCLAQPARLAALSLRQWARVLVQAREASLLGTVCHLAETHGGLESVPEPVRGHLWGGRMAAERNAEAILWELRCLQRELGWVKMQPALLKGAAYVAAQTPNAPGRLCNDVDILVPRAEIDRAETALRWMGWMTTHLTAYDQRYYREWMHELPPMEHMRRGSTLDVHHNILPETVRRQPDATRLLAQARPLGDGSGASVLAPHHMAIHCAVHLFSDGEWETAIRDLYDFHCLVKGFSAEQGELFWDALLDEADALAVSVYVHHALRCSRHLLGTRVPGRVISALSAQAPGRLRQWALDWVFLHAASHRFTSRRPVRHAISRLALLWRSHWIKMPPLLLLRHLFYKAFLAPRDDAADAVKEQGAGRHG
ncbi:nucleotidyltransferase family protein [Aquisalimonas sp.]|uniref:nucleotidyltransferase domain-containing protein n=1 Tax=unclassified Aquisalimonas TaxID=2644645 RepID=UPI0025BECC0B|nr:nucleotidyltransferase family protein [Aquisalimonas sp.]